MHQGHNSHFKSILTLLDVLVFLLDIPFQVDSTGHPLTLTTGAVTDLVDFPFGDPIDLGYLDDPLVAQLVGHEVKVGDAENIRFGAVEQSGAHVLLIVDLKHFPKELAQVHSLVYTASLFDRAVQFERFIKGLFLLEVFQVFDSASNQFLEVEKEVGFGTELVAAEILILVDVYFVVDQSEEAPDESFEALLFKSSHF